MNTSLTALSGVKVGHATHPEKRTGCTFILFPRDLPVAYKSYGGGAGTYNTEMLQNGKTYFRRHGIFIAGGSLQGLTSAEAITKQMITKKIGFQDGGVINPSISGAIVFDVGMFVGQYDSAYGKEAFDNLSGKEVVSGNVGAGTGTTVGKFSYTPDMKMLAMKSGVGNARVDLGNGVIVTALSVVNAMGNVVLENGKILAGNRNDTPSPKFRTFDNVSNLFTKSSSNTTISVVGINTDLRSREAYERIAHFGSQGQIRAIVPSNLSLDGDTVFVFSTEEKTSFLSPIGKEVAKSLWSDVAIDSIGHAAAKAVQESVYNACRQAQTIPFAGAYKGVIPSVGDY
ncbi:MAG: P1 family peptidase [Candidatus Levyibacteriota bacterium]